VLLLVVAALGNLLPHLVAAAAGPAGCWLGHGAKPPILGETVYRKQTREKESAGRRNIAQE
jgi:hypothetical protein